MPIPNFEPKIQALVAALPEAGASYGRLKVQNKSVSHLLAITGTTEPLAGEKSYVHMRRAFDVLHIPLKMHHLFKFKSDYAFTDEKGRVQLRDNLANSHLAHVGWHELVHAVFHVNEGKFEETAREEWEAELTAYLCSCYFGVRAIDSPLYLVRHDLRMTNITQVAAKASAYAWYLISAGKEKSVRTEASVTSSTPNAPAPAPVTDPTPSPPLLLPTNPLVAAGIL